MPDPRRDLRHVLSSAFLIRINLGGENGKMLESSVLCSNFYLEYNPLYKLIDDLLEKKQMFSATKIGVDTPDSYYAAKYIQLLDEFLNERDIAFRSLPYLIGPPIRIEQCKEFLYVIGSEKDAVEETEELVNLIRGCPEGILCSRARQCLTGLTLERFEENLLDVKLDNKKILVINFGPVYFTKEQLRSITKLFLPPLLKEKKGY